MCVCVCVRACVRVYTGSCAGACACARVCTCISGCTNPRKQSEIIVIDVNYLSPDQTYMPPTRKYLVDLEVGRLSQVWVFVI